VKLATLFMLLVLFMTACEKNTFSRIEQCQQLTPALLQHQLRLDKLPELEWLLATEEVEDDVQTQTMLSFRVVGGKMLRLPDNGHSHLLEPGHSMNVVCRFVYYPLHQQEGLSQQVMDGYEVFPSDIILNNQMIAPELIKDIHNSL
jgi:hypothetical protein